jgi:hypothetical protein
LRASSAWDARLKRNQLADPVSVDVVTDVDYRSGGLGTDDHRIVHHILADATVLVVGTSEPQIPIAAISTKT